jgi:hypothetical protein
MERRAIAPQYGLAPMPPRYTGERGQFGPWMDELYECLQSQYGHTPSSSEVMAALGTTGLSCLTTVPLQRVKAGTLHMGRC